MINLYKILYILQNHLISQVILLKKYFSDDLQNERESFEQQSIKTSFFNLFRRFSRQLQTFFHSQA